MITIGNPEAERLAREQSARTGESVEDVVLRALREQAAREAEHAPSASAASPAAASPWALLDEMAGSVDAPADWSAEHDHYLYGVPRRGRNE